MDAALTKFNKEWATGDREVARSMAHKYIEKHEAELSTHLGGKTLEELVAMVSAYRSAGREDDRTIADMWLLTKFPPQRITGIANMGGPPPVR